MSEAETVARGMIMISADSDSISKESPTSKLRVLARVTRNNPGPAVGDAQARAPESGPTRICLSCDVASAVGDDFKSYK